MDSIYCGSPFFRYLSYVVLILLILKPEMPQAQIWGSSGGCGWRVGNTHCSNIKTGSIGEFCSFVEQGTLSPSGSGVPAPTISELYGSLVEIRINSIEPTSVPPIYKGQCVLEQQQFFFGSENLPIPCKDGEYFDVNVMACVEKKHNNRCRVGNPIQISNGIKVQNETDSQFILGGGNAVEITRYYKSQAGLDWNIQTANSNLGYWQFKYTDQLQFSKITITSTGTLRYFVRVKNPEGYDYYFDSADGISWTNRNDGLEGLSKITENGVSLWKMLFTDNSYKLFDFQGKLVRVGFSNGDILSLEYSSRFKVNLNSESEPRYFDIKFNGFAIYRYSYQGDRLASITDSNFLTTNYFYSTNGNLTIVVFPAGTSKIFHYEDLNFPKALTGITDEKGARFVTWAYDSQGRAISSQHAGGADLTTLSYNNDGSTTVTNSLSKKTTYYFESGQGARHLTRVEGLPSANCAGAFKSYTYTASGLIESETDWNGNKTVFAYNTKGQEISRTEAYGTDLARSTITEWHSVFNLPIKVTDQSSEITYQYDDQTGQLISETKRALP